MLQIFTLYNATVALSTFALYLIYLALYRLFWSPLAHIPGPLLPALTYWYEFYFDVIQTGKYVFEIERLHEIYGNCPSLSHRSAHAG